MTLSRFQKEWDEAAKRWGLRVDIPFVVELANDQVTVPVLLRDFGAFHGMLLVTDFKLISTHTDELARLGYGVSCLSDPGGLAHPDDDQALIEMLSDWGWSGRDEAPTWYRESTS